LIDIRLTEEGKENNRADSTARRNQPGGAELNRVNATARRNQGQSLEWSLNDIRSPSFSHGQEYVALSRPIDFDKVAIFCNSNQIFEGSVVFTNVVYNELFN